MTLSGQCLVITLSSVVIVDAQHTILNLFVIYYIFSTIYKKISFTLLLAEKHHRDNWLISSSKTSSFRTQKGKIHSFSVKLSHYHKIKNKIQHCTLRQDYTRNRKSLMNVFYAIFSLYYWILSLFFLYRAFLPNIILSQVFHGIS